MKCFALLFLWRFAPWIPLCGIFHLLLWLPSIMQSSILTPSTRRTWSFVELIENGESFPIILFANNAANYSCGVDQVNDIEQRQVFRRLKLSYKEDPTSEEPEYSLQTKILLKADWNRKRCENKQGRGAGVSFQFSNEFRIDHWKRGYGAG